MVINPLYINKRTMLCRIVGGARTVDGQAEYLEILADVFGLECGVTTEGSSFLVFYYDHINSIITRNTQLLNTCYFAPIGCLVPIDPRSLHNMTTIAFHLNFTKEL